MGWMTTPHTIFWRRHTHTHIYITFLKHHLQHKNHLRSAKVYGDEWKGCDTMLLWRDECTSTSALTNFVWYGHLNYCATYDNCTSVLLQGCLIAAIQVIGDRIASHVSIKNHVKHANSKLLLGNCGNHWYLPETLWFLPGILRAFFKENYSCSLRSLNLNAWGKFPWSCWTPDWSRTPRPWQVWCCGTSEPSRARCCQSFTWSSLIRRMIRRPPGGFKHR